MFARLGTSELLMILLIVVIIFGPKQLPKLSKMVGKTIKGFKSGLESTDDEKDDE